MLIEFLYPELANLYGESGHRRFLQAIFPDAEYVHTALTERPAFSHRKVDFLFLGALSENAQEQVIKALQPYREKLLATLDEGCFALFTGNALEVLGESIEIAEGQSIPALKLFPFVAKRQMDQRLNCFYLGSLRGTLAQEAQAGDLSTSIVGYKSQFSQCYPKGDMEYFSQTEKGFGMNQQESGEGIIYKNFIGTYLIGPLLIMNPDFSRLWLGKMNKTPINLPFEETLQSAFRLRLEDFNKPDTVL